MFVIVVVVVFVGFVWLCCCCCCGLGCVVFLRVVGVRVVLVIFHPIDFLGMKEMKSNKQRVFEVWVGYMKLLHLSIDQLFVFCGCSFFWLPKLFSLSNFYMLGLISPPPMSSLIIDGNFGGLLWWISKRGAKKPWILQTCNDFPMMVFIFLVSLEMVLSDWSKVVRSWLTCSSLVVYLFSSRSRLWRSRLNSTRRVWIWNVKLRMKFIIALQHSTLKECLLNRIIQ